MEYHALFSRGKPILLGKVVEKKGPCDFLNQYLREAWKDVQRRLGAIPGKCPMRKVN